MGSSSPYLVNYSKRMSQLNERDKRSLLRLNLRLLNRILLGLYCLFIALSTLDVLSTLFAMDNFPGFHELNRLPASLFGTGVLGFVFATLVLKIIPAIVALYPLLLKDGPHVRPYKVRMVKLAAIIALIIVNLFYGYIVLVQNIPLIVHQI